MQYNSSAMQTETLNMITFIKVRVSWITFRKVDEIILSKRSIFPPQRHYKNTTFNQY